jgi:hypothetical protein
VILFFGPQPMHSSSDEYAGFQEWVWGRLPPSKFLAGRRRVLALLPRAIDRWSVDMAAASDSDSPAFAFMADSLRQDVRRLFGHKRYGSFWIIVLSSLVSEIVRLLVLWWLSSGDHQQLFRQWRRRRDG